MNIFMVDQDPVIAAQMMCDKHISKMVVESAQMLSTAHRVIDGESYIDASSGRKIRRWRFPDDPSKEAALYKATHINHPSNVWVREAIQNYMWLYRHFVALCDEYTHRYGRIHATDTKLRSILAKAPRNIPWSGPTPVRLAINEASCIDHNDPVGSYRRFYITKQKRFKMVWTGRPVPDWFTSNNQSNAHE